MKLKEKKILSTLSGTDNYRLKNFIIWWTCKTYVQFNYI